MAGTPSDVTNHSRTLHISHWDSEKSAEKALQPWQRKPFSGNCSMNTKLHINIYISSPIRKKKPHQERILECRGFEACLNIYLVFGSDLGSIIYCAATVMDMQTLDESKSNFFVS